MLFFAIDPLVALFLMAAWAIATAWAARSARPRQASLLTPERNAEREATRLLQGAEQHRQQVEVRARAIEAEDRLRLYAP